MSRNTAVIIGRKRIPGNCDLQCLVLTRCKLLRLGKAAQNSCRFAHRALRRLTVNLHHFLAGNGSRIGHLRADHSGRVCICASRRLQLRFHRKGRIGKTEAEGIENLVLRKSLEVAVSYIDVLLIDIPLLVPVVTGGGVVCDISGDGVRQLTGRRYGSLQYIQHAVAAFLAALPYIQHCRRLVTLHPLHIYDIAHIQKYHCARKRSAHQTEHLFLRFRQQITARFRFIVLILSGSPADHDHCRIGLLLCLIHQFLRQRHLFLEPGFPCPAGTGIVRILFQPRFVYRLQLLIQYKRALLKRLPDTGHITCIDQTAGACAALVIIKLSPAEKRDLLALAKRQHLPLIAQHDNTFRSHGPCRSRI